MVEIFSKSPEIKKAPFEAAKEVEQLKIDGLADAEVMTQMEAKKAEFKEKISKINDRLTRTLDSDFKTWASNLLDSSLDEKEYELVIQDTEAKLKEIQESFDLDMRGIEQRGRLDHAPISEQGHDLVRAMAVLNSSLNNFLTQDLENMIKQADNTDADAIAYARRMNPSEEKKAEVQVAEKQEDKSDMPTPSVGKMTSYNEKLKKALRGQVDDL